MVTLFVFIWFFFFFVNRNSTGGTCLERWGTRLQK